MDVTVIGAGVAGLTCAVELAEKGVAVEVIDRSEGLGSSCCSWFAGGMLAPWCELVSADPRVADLGSESVGWWREHVADIVMNGSLVLAHGRDVGELEQFSRRTQRFECLDGAALSQLEPDLAGRFNKGLFFHEEGHLDPRSALAALVRRLDSLGVRVQYGTRSSAGRPNAAAPGNAGAAGTVGADGAGGADGAARANGGAGADGAAGGNGALGGNRAAGAGCAERAPRAAPGWTINCTGLDARHTLRDLRGVKGEMLIVRLPHLSLSRPIRVLHPRVPVYVVPRRDGLFMIGATTIESDHPTRISARSMLELLSAAYALHPAFGEAEIVEIGTGVRPAFPDNLPRIRRVGNTLYVNGLYRHGFLLAPALARRVAEIVVYGRSFPEVMHEDLRERCFA